MLNKCEDLINRNKKVKISNAFFSVNEKRHIRRFAKKATMCVCVCVCVCACVCVCMCVCGCIFTHSMLYDHCDVVKRKVYIIYNIISSIIDRNS